MRSSVIRSVGFDRSGGVLEIEFNDGDLYQYRGVPEFLHRGLMVAESKGAFFNSRIANRFPYRHIDPLAVLSS